MNVSGLPLSKLSADTGSQPVTGSSRSAEVSPPGWLDIQSRIGADA